MSTLGKEVSDLGQVMKRMIQLVENLMPPVPQPTVVCPTHYSPGRHTCLPHHSPAQSYPSSCSQTASIWMDTPISLPSSPVIITQQHGVICNRDSLTHRPQDLQMGCPTLPSSTLPFSPFSLQSQSIVTKPHLPSSPPTVSGSIKSREHSPLLQDGEDDGSHQSSGCSQKTGLGGTYHNPTTGL